MIDKSFIKIKNRLIMRPKIVVIGSSNTDMVVKSSRIPQPGETVLGGKFILAAGGKGANQAVAAARLGGDVLFITRLGKDIFGEQSLENFKRDQIDTSGITRDPEHPSGVALIMVDENGENSISVAPGANMQLLPEHVEKLSARIIDSQIILMQLEIPLAVVETAARLGKMHDKTIILNPAPASMLPPDLLANVSILTPNRTEAELLSGMAIKDEKSAIMAAQNIRKMGIQSVILTMGSQGALVVHQDQAVMIPAFPIKPVDTTAAGDAFNGALAVALAQQKTLFEAVRFANAVAALAASKMGAQPSLPYRNEVEIFLQRHTQ
ncbi:ribokinase [candidate division KSB1 bacterium]|nr:ribokinase [candidate division KSB1 bacterium]